MRYIAFMMLIVLFIPHAVFGAFSESRNSVALSIMTLSGQQKGFYRTVSAQISPNDRNYPGYAFGLSFRSFGTSRLGAEIVFSYTKKSGTVEGLSLSTIQAFLGPVYSLPIIGSGERIIPYGTVGIVVVRNAIDLDSQTDLGFYAKLGIQGVITDRFGVAGSLVYSGVTIDYDSNKGLGGQDWISESHSYGDAQLVLEFNYFP